MKKNYSRILGQKGSMMVEALAMLGLITMVTPVLYKKAAERTTELQDINTANQMRTISKALDDFIKDHYTDFAAETDGGIQLTPEEITKFESYLPHGFSFDSRLLGNPKISLHKKTIGEAGREKASITGMVVIEPEGNVPMARTSKIASMIGPNGGLVREADAISGVGGGWSAVKDDYKFMKMDGTAVGDDFELSPGVIAVGSVHSITSGGSGGVSEDDVLFRNLSHGEEGNTMSTTLYLDNNDIEDVGNLIAQAVEINNEDPAAQASLVVGTGITSLADVDISGTLDVLGSTTLNDLVVGNGITVTGSGITVTGSGLFNNDLNVNGILTASGNTKLLGDETTIGQDTTDKLIVKATAEFDDIKAKNITATETLRGGGEGAAANFIATASGVTITQPNLVVGSNNLVVGENEALINYGGNGVVVNANKAGIFNTNGSYVSATGIGIEAEGKEILLKGHEGVGSLKLGNYGIIGQSDGADIKLERKDGNTVLSKHYLQSNTQTLTTPGTSIDMGTNDGERIKLAVDDNYLQLKERNSIPEIRTNVQDIYLDSGADIVVGGNLVTNVNNTANAATLEFAGNSRLKVTNEALYFADDMETAQNTDMSTISQDGVYMHRSGVIKLPRSETCGGDIGCLKSPAYIQADRLVANVDFPKAGTAFHVDSVPGDGRLYDAYQVNPAYTSVMHDIKLTTRGNARLSDILPDFINRGIYVMDNTYEENGSDWSDYKIENGAVTSGQPNNCSNSADCIASPWLGFVPIPQCPPGYAKVITVAPIRWKMSEAYYVTGYVPSSGTVMDSFRESFVNPTDPFAAEFKLGSPEGSDINTHTHGVTSGNILTFQTNTWLNTTMTVGRANEGVGAGEVHGWHAIMGFLYYGSLYSSYFSGLGYTDDSTLDQLGQSVIWNLFPVYNQEMAAISTVYCYFDREGGGWSSGTDYTDDYNQLQNFRYGYDKDNPDYVKRLNDPVLGYGEVW